MIRSIAMIVTSCFVCAAIADAGERVVLDNGLTLLMQPIADVDHVAIEAFYEIGFVHEPKGMDQAAHLLEHLVCYGASESFAQKEAMQKLNRIGMANAETLPTCTHYDYVLPVDDLALALQIEKERLTSLSFDRALIKKEAARCYQETDFVEANPASGMMKHAFIAFAQAWRHGATSARVRGGLDQMSVEDLRAFHREYYCPDKLTLVIVGNFKLDEAKKLVQDNLGQIENPQRQKEPAITWDKLPMRQSIEWDAKLSGVCLAFPPPMDRASSAAISLYGTMLMQRLAQDAELKRVAEMAICTSHTWKTDPLPFFVYAAAKQGQSLEDVERVLNTRFREISQTSKASTIQLPFLVAQLQAQATSLNPSMIRQQARMIQKMRGIDEQRAIGLVLGQAAINWAMLDRLMGAEAEKTAKQIGLMLAGKLNQLIDETLGETKMRVIHVVPAP